MMKVDKCVRFKRVVIGVSKPTRTQPKPTGPSQLSVGYGCKHLNPTKFSLDVGYVYLQPVIIEPTEVCELNNFFYMFDRCLSLISF